MWQEDSLDLRIQASLDSLSDKDLLSDEELILLQLDLMAELQYRKQLENAIVFADHRTVQ